MFDAEKPGDPAQGGGDHQETVVIEDESSLPGESIEDSDSLLSQTLRPSRLRKSPDHGEDWVVNSVNPDRLLLDLLRRVDGLEISRSAERERITKLKPKLLKRAPVLREKLEKKI